MARGGMNWKRKRMIGVLHLSPLPGAPRFAGSMDAICEAAVADAMAYRQGGADALMIENFGDLPFTRERVAAETVAGMAVVACAIKEAGVELPVGFNVLRNDVSSGLGLAATCGGEFVRVNVHTGAVEADQGIIQGEAFSTLRQRKNLCPQVEIWADVLVKHAVPIGDLGIEEAAPGCFSSRPGRCSHCLRGGYRRSNGPRRSQAREAGLSRCSAAGWKWREGGECRAAVRICGRVDRGLGAQGRWDARQSRGCGTGECAAERDGISGRVPSKARFRRADVSLQLTWCFQRAPENRWRRDRASQPGVSLAEPPGINPQGTDWQ